MRDLNHLKNPSTALNITLLKFSKLFCQIWRRKKKSPSEIWWKNELKQALRPMSANQLACRLFLLRRILTHGLLMNFPSHQRHQLSHIHINLSIAPGSNCKVYLLRVTCAHRPFRSAVKLINNFNSSFFLTVPALRHSFNHHLPSSVFKKCN